MISGIRMLYIDVVVYFCVFIPDLVIAEVNCSPSLHQQPCYLKVPATQGIMQGRYPITVSTTRIVHVSPFVQEQSYNP